MKQTTRYYCDDFLAGNTSFKCVKLKGDLICVLCFGAFFVLLLVKVVLNFLVVLKMFLLIGFMSQVGNLLACWTPLTNI